MPKYTYKCSECDDTHTAFHSMSVTLSDCLECGCVGSLQRLVTSFNLEKQDENIDKPSGFLVKKTIEDTRQEIQALKEKLVNDTLKD